MTWDWAFFERPLGRVKPISLEAVIMRVIRRQELLLTKDLICVWCWFDDVIAVPAFPICTRVEQRVATSWMSALKASSADYDHNTCSATETMFYLDSRSPSNSYKVLDETLLQTRPLVHRLSQTPVLVSTSETGLVIKTHCCPACLQTDQRFLCI